MNPLLAMLFSQQAPMQEEPNFMPQKPPPYILHEDPGMAEQAMQQAIPPPPFAQQGFMPQRQAIPIQPPQEGPGIAQRLEAMKPRVGNWTLDPTDSRPVQYQRRF